MTTLLVDLVARGGLFAIFLTMTAESAGIPISSEIVVPLGGSLAAAGVLPFAGVVVTPRRATSWAPRSRSASPAATGRRS